jgi:hypothetical protein
MVLLLGPEVLSRLMKEKKMSWNPFKEEIQEWIREKEDEFSLVRDSRIEGEYEEIERKMSLLIYA